MYSKSRNAPSGRSNNFQMLKLAAGVLFVTSLACTNIPSAIGKTSTNNDALIRDRNTPKAVSVNSNDQKARYTKFISGVVSDLAEHEKNIPYLYVGSDGSILIGIGEKMETADEFMSLKMKNSKGKVASAREKANAYATISKEKNRILNSKGGFSRYSAEHYKRLTTLRIDAKDSIQRASNYVENTAIEPLKKKVDNFDNIPDPAKKALIDMQYSMGDAAFSRKKWKNFYRAVDNGRWDWIANHCTRRGVHSDRNEWTKQQFLSAAKEQNQKLLVQAMAKQKGLNR